ncbi:uncharacterized protein [Magallana gigas]|uniref:uncharacterized protein isoform X2 n=1 Tax=Magallana gigas TaxID=29159 RepID=UPI003341E40D
MILRLVVFLFTGWICRVNGNQYIYVNESKTWEDARGYCKQKGFELSTLNGQEIDICNLTEVTELWTNNYIYTTPYLSLLGCYKKPGEMQFSSLENASVVECQILCSKSKRFAIQGNLCTCIQPDFNQSALQNAEQCNYTCDGEAICGGDNAISIYEKDANISNRLTEQPLFPPNNSWCLVYQCVNGAVKFEEKDCKNQDYDDDNDFFSCSFEPDTDCFLWHTKDNNLTWSIQNSPPQNDPKLSYNASYYAYVNGSDAASEQTAVLISRMKFKAADWCLRFRYFTETPVSMDVIIWDLIADENQSLVEIRNSTYKSNTNTIWHLVEWNINMTNDFKLMFKFETGENETEISIDDVTMIADSCNKTVSTLLNKGNGLQCTFGGEFDVCFRQDESNNDINWSLSNNERWLSSSVEIEKRASLISKFELNDIRINITMRFSRKSNLKLYWKDEQENKKFVNINTNDNTNGPFVTDSKTTYVNARSNLYIDGITTNEEIRIAFIKIKVISNSYTQGERVNRSFQIPDPYAMTISDVTNLRCIDGGGIKMSNAIKLSGKPLTKKGIPSAVQIYRMNNSYWKTSDANTLRTFVCEQDNESNNSCKILADFELPREEVQNTNVGWIAAVLAGLLGLIIVCIVSIIFYKRIYSKNNQRTKDFSTGEPNSIKLTNQKVEGTKNDNVEEDYDHLHQSQPNACASSSENVYSHTTDNQYGLLPVITDDTYDHTVGREGEYGTTQVCQDNENTYDHT